MANTVYGVNDPETNKVWAKKLNVEAMKKAWISKFIGTSDNSLIQEQKDLKKAAGDRITVTLRVLLQGKGVKGDTILKGQEERLLTYTDNLFIDQLRHAADRGGNMSQQRVLFNLRTQCNDALSDWWAARMDRAFFLQAAGYVGPEVIEHGETYNGTDTEYSGLNATLAPSTGRHFFSEAAADSDDDLDSSGDTMTLSLIDDLVTQAKLSSPQIRSIKVEGEDCYVLFLHPRQFRDLKRDTSTGGWLDIQKAAMSGGDVKNNPIFTGAKGMYNNVILHESSRVPRGISAVDGTSIDTVRRGIFCGAQSAAIAFGQGHDFESWVWKEEEEDYGNQLGVAAGCICGLKKLKFNSVDFGSMVLSTYAAA
jgi:N4-gp56 family major capsid protein